MTAATLTTPALYPMLDKPYAAVLFDFDGVLGRTMEDNFRAWSYAFAKRGVTLEPTEYYLLEGATAAELAATVLARHALDPALAPRVVADKEQHYLAHNAFTFYDGTPALLEKISRLPLKVGLVSGAGYRRLEATCGKEFLGSFDVTVAGEDVSRGKPDPEPYSCAARKLSLSPAQCLVIENAPLGIRAAKSAGMDCVAITSTLERGFLMEADVVVAHLGELPQVVRCLEALTK